MVGPTLGLKVNRVGAFVGLRVFSGFLPLVGLAVFVFFSVGDQVPNFLVGPIVGVPVVVDGLFVGAKVLTEGAFVGFLVLIWVGPLVGLFVFALGAFEGDHVPKLSVGPIVGVAVSEDGDAVGFFVGRVVGE